jgi:predicted Kef-type K+ transport protein
MRVVQDEYMPAKVDGRLIGLVLSLCNTIVNLKAVAKTHKNITYDFVAIEIYGLIVDNLAYEYKMIIRHIQQTY